jgi:hypothetical protein
VSQKWYCRFAGLVQGPFTLEVLKALKLAGQVDENSPVRPESSSVWIHLGDLLETRAAADKSGSSLGPPPPPPIRQGPPPVKGREEPRDFPALGAPPSPEAEVTPRRRLSKTSKDAQMWAWIGLIGALGTVAALLVLVLSGVISLESGKKPESKPASTKTVAGEATVEEPTPDKKASSAEDGVAKEAEPGVPTKETPKAAPPKKSSVDVAAKKPTADATADPLKGINKWFGPNMQIGSARERIRVPAVWFAWNDYGEAVDSFDMDDIEPEREASKTSAGTKNDDESGEEMESDEEEPKPKRRRPRQKPEFVFVEVEVTRNRGGATIEYQSWNGTVDKKFLARLYDEQGREIPPVPPAATKGVKRLDKIGMPGGSTVTDVLVFEVPKHRFEKLRLALPLSAIGIEATSPYIGFEFTPGSLGREELGEVGAKISESPEMEDDPAEPAPKSKRPEPETEPESE